jgi:type I restriction enzyme, R subunit
VTYAQSLIDDFSVKNKDPYLVASVDMLDTGIDVPEIVNLVFFKLVRSKTKFWQMIGRGTRLCEDLFAPGEHKKEFIIFDYCQNLEFFDANPDGYETKVQESVKQKIFKRRLALVATLQKNKREDEALGRFIEILKDQMHDVVNAMNLDNFIVRKHRKEVETFVDRSRWETVDDEDVYTLETRLSGLPSPDEDDEYSRRFDLLILNLQTALLRKSKAQETYQIKIREIAGGLEDKSSIPLVAAQMELILELQTDQWWNDVSLPMLEDVRIRLRDLTRFLDKGAGLVDVFTNFEDEIGEESEPYNLVKSDPKLKDYREGVQRFIRDHQDHVAIQRLKNNEPISATDVAALENILFAEGGPIPRTVYEKIFGEKPLGVLVRSVVGLDKKAAKEAFAEFLAEAPLHPDQISFLDEVVDYLVKNGTMELKVMFETPFTHIHDQGIEGVFGDRSKKVISLVQRINDNAYKAQDGA